MGCATVDCCSPYLMSQGSVVIIKDYARKEHGEERVYYNLSCSLSGGEARAGTRTRDQGRMLLTGLPSLLSQTPQDYLPRGGIPHSGVATHTYHQSGRLTDRPVDVLGTLSQLRAPSSQVTLVCVELTEKPNQPPPQCTSIIETST